MQKKKFDQYDIKLGIFLFYFIIFSYKILNLPKKKILNDKIRVETLAACQPVEFALELGFENIVLEGDSEVLIKLLNSCSRSLAPFGHIISDIIFLASCFSCFRATHVRRHCNKVAHSLARRAISSSPLSVWMKDVLLALLFVIQADLHSLS